MSQESGLETLQRMLRGEIPSPPVMKLVGFEAVEFSAERVVFRMQTDERHTNPMGTVHGGILCDIADAALGGAMHTTLKPGETYTTLELSINFLKPVWKSTLTATGRVVKRTRKIGMTECDVVDEKGSLVARAKSTCLVLDGSDATGR